MNKTEFVTYIAKQNSCTKTEAEKIINVFTNSIMSALGEKEEVALIGFGTFASTRVEERAGRNPSTGEPMTIAAYNQPRFKAGQKLKNACNDK
ncbi:MAG: HU family DNA-binding protein [Rickettsiaceae bacterium]